MSSDTAERVEEFGYAMLKTVEVSGTYNRKLLRSVKPSLKEQVLQWLNQLRHNQPCSLKTKRDNFLTSHRLKKKVKTLAVNWQVFIVHPLFDTPCVNIKVFLSST